MADSALNYFVARGTNAERLAFTPVPPTPAAGPDPLHIFYETDTGDTYAWDGAAWDQVNTATSLADGDYGDFTFAAGVATIDAGVVTLAKQANMATASVVYRKTAGAGAPEVQTLATLKTDLGLTGTNSGDQTSIVGITGTVAEFNAAITDGDLATGGGTATGTNTGDQTSIVGITGTKAQFDTACSDGNFLYVGDVTQYTDEMAQDAVGTILVDSGTIDFTYTDATPEITAAVIANSITDTHLSSTSGEEVFLGRTTVTADATVDIPLPSGYDSFRIEFYLDPSTDSISINAALTADNFSNILAGATDYAYTQHRGSGTSAAVTSSNGTTIWNLLVASGQGNDTNEFFAGHFYVINSKETAPTSVIMHYNYVTPGAAYGLGYFNGAYKPTTVIDGIRITPSAGDFTGFFKVWGRKAGI